MRRYRARARFSARSTSGIEVTSHLPQEVVGLEGHTQPLGRLEAREPPEEAKIVAHVDDRQSERGPSIKTFARPAALRAEVQIREVEVRQEDQEALGR